MQFEPDHGNNLEGRNNGPGESSEPLSEASFPPEARRVKNRFLGVSTKTHAALARDIKASLPAGVILDEISIYRSGKSADSLTFAITTLCIPAGREEDLLRWREEIERKWEIALIIKKETVSSSVAAQLKTAADRDGIIRDKDRVMRLVSRIHGNSPGDWYGPPPEAPLGSAVDLSHLPFISIDPAEALELDDVLWAEPRQGGGWRLYAAFTDVTWRVEQGSLQDLYASRAGFSLVGRSMSVPILGHGVAYNDLSLLQGKDRLAWTVALEIAPDGAVQSAEFMRAIVRNTRQFSYEEVEEIGFGKPDPQSGLLRDLFGAASALRSKRLSDVYFAKVSEQGENRIIVQEAMIAARTAIAGLLADCGLPALYRVQSLPSERRLAELVAAANRAGIPAEAQDLEVSKRFNALLLALKEKREHELFNEIINTFQETARYSSNNIGHHALGVDNYIEIKGLRTYAGVVNQRQLAAALGLRDSLSESQVRQHALRLNRKERAIDDNRSRLLNFEKVYTFLQNVGDVLDGQAAGGGSPTVKIPSLGITARMVGEASDLKVGAQVKAIPVGYDSIRGCFLVKLEDSRD